jgi:hypothetical protein
MLLNLIEKIRLIAQADFVLLPDALLANIDYLKGDIRNKPEGERNEPHPT